MVKDGVTVIKAGTLQVGNGGTTGNIMGVVSNDGVLAFNRSDRYVQADVINGSGQVIQQGSGTTVFNAINGYTGGTTVAAGALAVGDAAKASAAINSGGPVTVQAGATFGGYGSVKGNVTNAGTLAVADAFPGLGGGAGGFAITGNLINSGTVNLAGAAPGNRLTVTGNYQGQSGVVALNTFLGADNSPSDKLVISGGAASGNTTLRITNQGGLGAKTTGNGIQVVQALNGATTAPGAFATNAGVYAGAYSYQLFRGGVTAGTEQSWYLRSELVDPNPGGRTFEPFGVRIDPPGVPTYRPGVPIYTEVPSLARELAVQQIGTFHERQGNQDLLTGTGRFPSGWARTWGDHFSERRDGTVRQSFSGNIFGMQAGQDLYARSTDSGHQDRFGVFLGYARADGNVKGFATGQDDYRAGKLAIDAYSLGGYWTHVGPSGWYTDTVIMGSHLKVKPNSTAGDTASTDGKAFTASVEAGLPIVLKPNLTLEPQAQIIYQNTRIDAVRDSASDVSFAPKNALIGRVGARLQGEFQAGGTTWKPYLRADLLHTLGGNDNVRFNDTTAITSAMGGTQARLGGGVSVRASERVSVYASTGYGFNLGGERREMVQGNVGVQIRW